MFNVSFFSAFLSVEIEDKYNVKDNQMGYFFVALSGPYLIAAVICPIIFKTTPRKLQFVISLVVSGFAYLLMGPSQLVNLPDKLAIIITGLVILGLI